MFITKNLVRMHDIDLAGILYFPRQFRFVHEALEDFMESENLGFEELFHNKEFLFVIVHCESNYLVPVHIGNKLEVHLSVENISTTSFTLNYSIYRSDGVKVGTAKTVHVCIDKETRIKMVIPKELRSILERHLIE